MEQQYQFFLLIIIFAFCLLLLEWSQMNNEGKSYIWNLKRNSIIHLPYTYPKVIYGHVHMAKTGGTTLNGKMASRYERVCGHKGYSYDAFNLNTRVKKFTAGGVMDLKDLKDSMSKVHPGYSRGRIHMDVMAEIGYHDCDWISHEYSSPIWWGIWRGISGHVVGNLSLELHVPCRDPVEHLMSMCNHRYLTFSCEKADFPEKQIQNIRECLMFQARYSENLRKHPNMSVKCFPTALGLGDGGIDKYIKYMGDKKGMQLRRIQSVFAPRSTNSRRNKTGECIWNDMETRKWMRSYLINETKYFKFCDQCIGTMNDISMDY